MPPLTLENASALVSGGVSPADLKQEKKLMQAKAVADQPKTLKGTVERAFYYQGKPLEVGKPAELPRVFALEMQAANKFKIEEPPAPPADPPPKASPSQPEARSRKVGGEKDAG